MIFHENCLLADNSHEISYLIFFQKLTKMLQNLSSVADVVGALRVKEKHKGNLKTCCRAKVQLSKILNVQL